MEIYKNLSGRSGISAFRIELDSIIVRFRDGSEYLYSTLRPGPLRLERMKALAITGRGLNSFINVYVKRAYERRIR